MTTRKNFDPRWMCHFSETSEDCYKFPSRWGQVDSTL